MPKTSGSFTPDGHDEQDWLALFFWLLSLATTWVYHAHIYAWYGQVREIAEDIAQETLARAFECIQSARRDEHPPINDLKAFCRTIAFHLFLDRARKERRLIRSASDWDIDALYAATHTLLDIAEVAIDKLILEGSIVNVAKAAARFSGKSRSALLRHIAWVMTSSEEPELLEQIFLKEGIHLSDYLDWPSDDPKARSRQASLLCQIRKRLKENS
jgi:DNA-directed RNA polymerase specialized sigma24 family protein